VRRRLGAIPTGTAEVSYEISIATNILFDGPGFDQITDALTFEASRDD
jgi:hypothetical protein